MTDYDYKTPSVCRDGDELDEFLTELQAQNPAIESYSAAVRYCVRQQMQRDILTEEHDNE